ncbi:MAG: PilZ domain-containing protein [bacterium]|nr:PilZ domain-containing protein [bacterium]
MEPNAVATQEKGAKDITKGNRCLLTFMGQHFMVDVVDVAGDIVRVSFPGCDYPVEGMAVDLEFHDPSGFNSYRSVVVNGPNQAGDGIVLSRPEEARRTRHRDSCRVPTDLTVQVKDQAHIRRYDAALINLSGGGALINTTAPFEFNTAIEVTLSLPGEATLRLQGRVVHANNAATNRITEDVKRTFGVRFFGMEPSMTESLTRYIWARLRDLYADV